MNLLETLRNQGKSLFHFILKINIYSQSNNSVEELPEDSPDKLEKKISALGRFKKVIQKLLLNYQQRSSGKERKFKQASLFANSLTNVAALSQVLHGVAEVLSQKMDLLWKAEVSSTLSYEKEVEGGKGKVFYYVTDNPETPQAEMAEEAALAVIDKFDPRACAVHLIYCALAASLDKPWYGNFVIDDRQLLEYTGFVKRRDLCRDEQLNILYDLLQQPAQVLASIAWPKQGEVEAFTIRDVKIWDVSIEREFKTDKTGDHKLVGLKVTGKPGEWTKYFLNKSEYYCQTGIITKKTVQKLFSIGKQNAGAARLLIWLTFQIQSGFKDDSVIGFTLMKIAYGADKVAIAHSDRQKRRQMADDLDTDLKVVKEAGWQVELETELAWLTGHNRTKRPIGYWNALLNTKWRFHLPAEVEERLILPESKPIANKIQPPSGNVIREARKAKGWSRVFFAEIMGKSVSWVDAVETGHRQVSQKDLSNLINQLQLN